MNRDEIKRRVLERIKDRQEWPDQGLARMGLIQVAFDNSWYLDELN